MRPFFAVVFDFGICANPAASAVTDVDKRRKRHVSLSTWRVAGCRRPVGHDRPATGTARRLVTLSSGVPHNMQRNSCRAGGCSQFLGRVDRPINRRFISRGCSAS